MFRVLDFVIILRWTAIATTALSIFGYELVRENTTLPINHIFLASCVALAITLFITWKPTSRFLWLIARRLNPALYPDLNGEWEGEIIFEGQASPLEARAVIRQFLLKTEIDMHTATAKSQTLEATPAKTNGQFKLYYTYLAEPKDPQFGDYKGSTIFDVRYVEDGTKKLLELSGRYYTDRATIGRTTLRQISHNPNSDVSFY